MHACQPRTVFNCRDVTSISVTRSRGVSSLRFGLCLGLRRLVNVSWFAGCWWLRAVSRREMTVEDTVKYKQWYSRGQNDTTPGQPERFSNAKSTLYPKL